MGFQSLSLDASNLTATFISDGSSVTVDADEPLSRLFDGDFTIANGDCQIQNNNQAFNLTYDFGAGNGKPIGDIGIQFRGDGDGKATRFQFQVSNDINAAFTTIGTVRPDNSTIETDTTSMFRAFGVGNEPGFQTNPLISYRYWRINFNTSGTYEDADKTTILEVKVYTVSDEDLFRKDYNVEFDDALLDLAGWKNPRFEGSKLTAARRNRFFKGDISYGLNPVVEHKTACIFLGKDIDEGDALDKDVPLTEVMNHSYLTIDKILFINPETDDVEIVARENMNERAFNRLVAENFPEGSSVVVKSLENQKNKLKPQHFVKFNQGQLMKVYSYTANTGGFDDGVFGGHEVYEHKGDNKSVVSGSGLFGFGQTAAASQSLFNTESIQFTTLFPAELSFYEGNYSTATMGSKLINISASISSSNQAGSTLGGGVPSETGGGGTFPSDIRLKENIIYLRKSISGIPIYTFNYIGRKEKYVGTMAQDLIKLGRTDAIVLDNNGYYSVYYDKIDVNFNVIK